MSLARSNTSASSKAPDKRKRIGGPPRPDPRDSPSFEDPGSASGASDGSDDEGQEGSAAATQNSSAASATSAQGKGAKRPLVAAQVNPPKRPLTRQRDFRLLNLTLMTHQESTREVTQNKTMRGRDGLLQHERSMEAMEQRLMSTLRAEFRREQQEQALSSAAPVPSSVTKALYSITPLKEKEFEVWLSHVDDAFRGAGMSAMFRASSVRSNSSADQLDLLEASQYPLSWKNAAWTALRQAIGGDSTAYSMSMSVKPGDVLSLLRAVRAFYERRAIPHQTQLRKELIRISISDYPDVKHYIAALELIFNKLAALGDVISDQVRRFHLIEGLSDEYHSVVSSVMAYEGPHGAQADYAKAVQIISS